MSQSTMGFVIAVTSALACTNEPPAPDLESLAQAVASALRTAYSGDTVTARRAVLLDGGPTPFDSMVMKAIRRGGELLAAEGGAQAVTILRTEGVSFHGDTAAVWVTKWTCDPSVTRGFTGWGTDVEYRFVPVVRGVPTGRRRWRALPDGQMRLSDGTC